MPTHVRAQIRAAAVALLTGLTTTGTRVHASRVRPLDTDRLPALLVETNDEVIDAGSIGSLQERSLTLTVRGLAKATGALDDTLDAIALEVETALAASPTLSGEAKDCALRRINVELDDSLDKPVGVISLDYQVTYFTLAGSPGTLA